MSTLSFTPLIANIDSAKGIVTVTCFLVHNGIRVCNLP